MHLQELKVWQVGPAGQQKALLTLAAWDHLHQRIKQHQGTILSSL